MKHAPDAPPPATAPRGRCAAWFRALRPLHWVKNLLVFVPAVAAHRFDRTTLDAAMAMFAAMGLAASAIYVVNDIADREADRRHARKRRRPFASGELKPAAGWAVAAALLALAATIAITLLPAAATIALGGYVILAMSYSFAIKRRVGLDVAVLAVLYAVRILAGGAATGIEVSSWLLALSLALFASLALAKRHAEVRESAAGSADRLPGRGYRPRDLGWLRVAGIVCGAAASAGLVFYAASLSGVRYYARPGWLYVLAPIVFVWVLRVWTRAAGGRMHDDPLVDAMTDLPGLALVATGVLVFVAAF